MRTSKRQRERLREVENLPLAVKRTLVGTYVHPFRGPGDRRSMKVVGVHPSGTKLLVTLTGGPPSEVTWAGLSPEDLDKLLQNQEVHSRR